jgi:hypothetical protein
VGTKDHAVVCIWMFCLKHTQNMVMHDLENYHQLTFLGIPCVQDVEIQTQEILSTTVDVEYLYVNTGAVLKTF